jgi:hypothetical protein
MRATQWATRLLLAVVVAAVVVGVAVAPALMESGGTADADVETPEYDLDRIATEEIVAEGEVDPDVDGTGKVVVIDDDHSNRFSRSDIGALVRGLTRTGAEVRFHTDGELNESLAGADAYVVLDPGTEYTAEEVGAVKTFADEGGRVFVGAEPDRIRVSASLFGTSITTVESEVTTLSSGLGFHFDTEYLYNIQENDGNYRNVVVQPRGGDAFADVERMTMYTAAEVHTRGGQPVLFTTEGTRETGTNRTGAVPVAAVDGNVLGMGDTTFLDASHYNVADNEAAIGYVVEFLLSGDRVAPEPEPEPEPEDGNGDGTGDTADGTATPAADVGDAAGTLRVAG